MPARIVFVTVQDDRAVIRKALNCGARWYVLECDAGSELVAAVRTAFEGGRYLSANARCVLEKARRPVVNDEENTLMLPNARGGFPLLAAGGAE